MGLKSRMSDKIQLYFSVCNRDTYAHVSKCKQCLYNNLNGNNNPECAFENCNAEIL